MRLSSPSCVCGCRYLHTRVVVIVLVQHVVVSSPYDCLVFVDVYLCLDDLNEQNIYNRRQKIKSMVFSIL